MAAPKGFPILFIASSRIGDAVLASGLIKRLHDDHPDARFTIVAGPVSAPLFADTPGLERLIVMRKEKGGGHWFKLWSQVRGRNWGLIVDRRGSGIGRFLRARRRAIHRAHGGEPMHKVVEAARLLKLADEPPAPFLFTSPQTEARAAAILEHGQGPILALGPAANWMGKTWPAERFALTAVQLMHKGQPFQKGRVLILGGPDDRRAAEPLRRSLPRERWIDLTGEGDLLTAYACLKQARLFIGNDSGLMHLAAAAGAPTLGLFGPSDDRLYAPWGPYTRVVRGPRSFVEIKTKDPDLNQPVCHMLDLKVEQVIAEAKALFEDSRPLFAAKRSRKPKAAAR
ncbi:MAG: glycosyltransferase family 9 protein [Caulobacteraceae bacterium]